MNSSQRSCGSPLIARAVSAILGAIAATTAFADDATPAEKPADDVTQLSDIAVTENPLNTIANAPSASSFGFTKPLMETPRTVSLVSEEQLTLMGISTVEDLTKAVPGVYTTTRYGLQGGINVRSVQADTYYRGMKRMNMQGHARTVLAGMDNIEVVKGPPSPIYGMGKIGGYTNISPKSGRAKVGGYLQGMQGFGQGVFGSYDKAEGSFGLGGPFEIGSKRGGYYVYGLIEDSKTYIKQVSAKQKYLQATGSSDNFIGPFRVETGTQLQHSITSGAYLNRITQDLVDNGRYITGSPLVNLDLNGDGRVGYVETYAASPVRGNISANNQALTQRFAWQNDSAGNPLPLSSFQKVNGIPATMLAYLNAHPEVNCQAANIMRTMPAGGPLPLSGQIPAGFALNPCTVGYTKVDYRRNGSWEREQNAKLGLGFFDLIYDVNPDFTVKDQTFYDAMDTFKDSFLPYGEKQDVHVFENKLTVTKRLTKLPAWLQVNSLASIDYRKTVGGIRSSGGDFDWRQDIMLGDGRQLANNSFWNQLDDNTYANGAPATTMRRSSYDEKGAGIMFDVDFFRNTNLLAGIRYDKSHAEGSDAPPFDANFGQSPGVGVVCTAPGTGCPGRFNPPSPIVQAAEGTDSGKSWSVSLSQGLPWGLRPYATYAETSLMLDGANNIVAVNVIQAGHIGSATLKEVGIKSALFHDKLMITTAGYDQTRTDVAAPADPGAGANVSSTRYRGIETEIKFAPMRNLFVSAYALWQKGEYIVAVPPGTNVDVSARDLGFQDIKDPVTGAVLFPAEAFLYGGRPQLVMPTGSNAFKDRTGDPKTQLGLNMSYQLSNGIGFLVGAQHFSSAWADRIKTVRLPDATPVDAAITFDRDTWHFKLNGYNVTNERYFRANLGDGNGKLISAMPSARWEFTLRKDFR